MSSIDLENLTIPKSTNCRFLLSACPELELYLVLPCAMLPIYFSEPPEKRRTLLSHTGHGAGVLQEGEGDVTSDFALMVEAALGISAELLVNRQARYNMAVSLKEKSLTDKLHEIRKMCASLL